jgi:sec-independent protein translocase protein TatA
VVILLLVFGARRLPEIGRSLGSGMREFKQSITGESSQQPAIGPPQQAAPQQAAPPQAAPQQPAPPPAAQAPAQGEAQAEVAPVPQPTGGGAPVESQQQN